MAGTLQYVGNTNLLIKDFEVRSAGKGMTTHFRVTSPLLRGGTGIFDSLQNYFNYLVSQGASVDFRGIDGGSDRELIVEIAGLTTTTSGLLDERYDDQWELLSNEQTDSIFANPLLFSGSSPVLNYNAKIILSRLSRDGGTIASVVKDCNDDIDNGNLTAPTPTTGGTSDNRFQKPTSAAATQLVLEIQKTQTEFARPTYILRHTSYCSATATYNTSTAHTNKLYTTSQLLTEVGSGWTVNLPNRLYSKIAGIPTEAAPSDEAAFYSWAWRKLITREPVLANHVVEINTEYELALWSNLRYALR